MNCKYNTDEERKEAIRQSQAKYRASDKAKKQRQEYYQNAVKPNREKMQARKEYAKEYNKQYVQKEYVKAKKREQAKLTYNSNSKAKARRLALSKKYYEEHKNKMLDYQHNYYMQHKAEIAERKRKWRLRKLVKGE